ncbi:DOG1 domain-containing protein [Artemisia annua]|uniref:DOG1 domain-containing protein n=1 Tax=Artemisia annua TaxID=35608 RepID=A0A2U1LRI2_ARTAN|nr:DOG1 domain-containing protein [Artemisia annua]
MASPRTTGLGGFVASSSIRDTLRCDQSERSGWKMYRPWRQERHHRSAVVLVTSASLEKQLKALEERVDKQLKWFQAQYSQALNPTLPKDIYELLMLNSLIKSTPTLASSLAHAGAREKAISQLTHDLRIEEAVIDEEMTEIQANCILNLPFALTQSRKVQWVCFGERSINALETVVQKVLSQSDAAEFLVAFGRIQGVALVFLGVWITYP